MDQTRAHHRNGRFRNLHTDEAKSTGDLLRWRWQRYQRGIPPAPSYDFPLAENSPGFLQGNRTEATLTWIGQSTLLLQLGGLNILTDPHFAQRASPSQEFGPQRAVPPGLALADLPPIDLVLVSHNHYDHCDETTIQALLARSGGTKSVFIVPLGLGSLLSEWGGVHEVHELDWWQSRQCGPATVTAVPVQHWSKRSPFDAFRTLWAGFVVEAGGRRFFFDGDSGYSPDFSEIRQRLGPLDLAALPIGAYAPRWFMQPYHMNPAEAVQAHLDLQAGLSVAIHWGTFALADEPLDEPPRLLAKALAEQQLSTDAFRVLAHGETLLLDAALAPSEGKEP